MSTPSVSIAIRAFRSEWLDDAVASVLAQTHRDLELIVYDDAGTLEAQVRTHADPRIRYVRATARLGPSGRFLAAVSHCRAPVIGLLDDDDVYEPTCVERLLGALESDEEAGIAFCRTTYVWNGQHVRPHDARLAGRLTDVAASMLRDRWTVSPSHMLLRRTAFDAAMAAQPMPDGVSPDVFVNLRVALAGWRHVLVDAPLVRYRWHDAQLSRQGVSSMTLAVRTWEHLQLHDARLSTLRDELLARAYLARALFHLRDGARKSARADLDAAARVSSDAFPLSRRLMRVATLVPVAGPALARTWLRVSPAARARKRPPTRVGGR